MIVIVCALIYDLNTPERLHTFPMVFLFFGSALAGLSAGRLLPEAERSTLVRTWPKTIGATVAAITTLGLIVALIDRGALSPTLHPRPHRPRSPRQRRNMGESSPPSHSSLKPSSDGSQASSTSPKRPHNPSKRRNSPLRCEKC